MPKEIVDALMKQIRAGKLPAFCRKEGIKGEKCAHAYANVIGNKIERRKAAKGGNWSEDLLKSFGHYTQIPLEDEIIVEDDGIWLLAADKDTRLRLIDGRTVPVAESAHMASLGAWVHPDYDISFHIDHRSDKTVDATIKDVRYDLERGLYLKVNTEDEQIMSALETGDIRPSIETSVEVKDGVIDFYFPTGVGLMWEGEPMGAEVGAEAPPAEAMAALGGDLVTEDPKPEQEPKVEADPKKTEEGDPKKTPPTPTPPEPPKAPEPPAKGEDDFKAKYEELLTKLEANKDKDNPYVEELRLSYISRLPEGMREDYKETGIEELKTLVSLSEAVRVEFEDRLKATEKRVAPIIQERDKIESIKKDVDEYGAMTSEKWAQVKAMELTMRGRPIPENIQKILGEKNLQLAIDEAQKLKKR
jgi:hypothetical protein